MSEPTLTIFREEHSLQLLCTLHEEVEPVLATYETQCVCGGAKYNNKQYELKKPSEIQ